MLALLNSIIFIVADPLPTMPSLSIPPPTCHSGYDFGYLMRVLTGRKLPDDEGDFFALMSLYFPKVYDVKYLMKSCKNLKGGLQEVADSLEVSTGGALGSKWLLGTLDNNLGRLFLRFEGTLLKIEV